jgi:hypothetical protein
VLTDALAMGPDNRGHQLGASAPHLLLRSVVCTHGAVELDVEYAPRPEYGIVVPLLSHVDDGVTARGGAEWLVLSTPVPMETGRLHRARPARTAGGRHRPIRSAPRMLATIDAIEQRVTDDRGLVYRYRTEGGVDGLAGEEGTFLLCTFWLAHALAMAGQVERARRVFEHAAGYANDVGLLAEEIDPENGGLLGNFPQAFSHIGLINAAWAITEAEGRAAARH